MRPRRRIDIWRGAALLAIPGLAVYAAFMLAPIGLALFYGITDWNGVSPTFSIVGLDNVARAVGDRDVRSAFVVTLLVAACGTVAVNALAIPLAVLLAREDRATAAYRLAVIFPLTLSAVVIGQVWRTLLNTNGVVNGVLAGLGLPVVAFLGRPDSALVSLIVVTVWATLGLTTILYIAALKTIPAEIVDAAVIDGATPFQRFRHVTLPLLAGAVTVNVVLLMIFYMRLYEYVLVMTGGGPVESTRTVAVLLVELAFERNLFGFGSAVAVLLLALVAAIAVALLWVLRRREEDA
jgi:ABC-type sugar transport system permease subunit